MYFYVSSPALPKARPRRQPPPCPRAPQTPRSPPLGRLRTRAPVRGRTGRTVKTQSGCACGGAKCRWRAAQGSRRTRITTVRLVQAALAMIRLGGGNTIYAPVARTLQQESPSRGAVCMQHSSNGRRKLKYSEDAGGGGEGHRLRF